MTSRTSRLLPVLVALTSLGSGGWTGDPVKVEAQNPVCGFCYSVGSNIHYAPDPRLWGMEAIFGVGPGVHGWHGYFYYGTCTFSHGVCFAWDSSAQEGSQTVVDPVQLADEVAEAVSEGDVERLADFTSHPSVRIAHKRTALQVVGCGGAVVGHVPIDAELLATLTAPVPAPLRKGPDS